MSEPRVLVLDIETAPMKVWSFSLYPKALGIEQIIEPTRMISWAAQWHGGGKSVMFASEYHHGHDVMVRRIYDLLVEADAVVHFNGDSFDMRHLNREFQQAKLPLRPPIKSIDLYKAAKRAMWFDSNKLDWISRQLGVGRKVGHSGFRLWRDCLTESPADDPNRQRRAWNLMKKYNKGDVVVTAALYDEILPLIPQAMHPNWALYADDGDVCPKCGSAEVQKRGVSRTTLGAYQRYQCQACGQWSRGGRAIQAGGLRGAS